MLSNCELVWRGYAEIPYLMAVEECLPYLVPSSRFHRVFLEVYRVDGRLLRVLDDFEDVPREYIRVRLYLRHVGSAWIYIANRRVEGTIVESGDYAEYICNEPTCRSLITSKDLCYT